MFDPLAALQMTAGLPQMTALQELRIFDEDRKWESLLPRLTCLPLLRSLADVTYVKTEDNLSGLIRITLLTALGALMWTRHWVVCLGALTRLAKISAGYLASLPEGRQFEGPALQRLPTSLTWLTLCHSDPGGSAEGMRVLAEMTRLDCLEIGWTSSYTDALGSWSLEGPKAWCERLGGLRQLALVGRPTGAPDLSLLARHLPALEHLRLRLGDFNGVQHLSVLTRLTLLLLYKETDGVTDVPVRGDEGERLGLPSFLLPMRQLRSLDFYWDVRVGRRSRTACLCFQTWNVSGSDWRGWRRTRLSRVLSRDFKSSIRACGASPRGTGT